MRAGVQVGTGTNRESVVMVRDSSISAHLSDGCRDGKFVGRVECWALFEEEKPVEFSCIKYERERKMINGSAAGAAEGCKRNELSKGRHSK